MANNYVIGRGRLYFDRFDDAGASTGFRYLGNTSAISVTKNAQTLDHYDSDSGMKVKDKSVTLQEDITMSFTTDNIDPNNLALWFGGTVGAGTVEAPLTGEDITLASPVQAGVAYYLGHEGVSNVTAVVAGVGGATILAADYSVDASGGLITFDGTGLDPTKGVVVTFDAAGGTTTGTIIDANSTIYGSMRYVSDNPVGTNQNMMYPYVKLTPNGNYELKGDTWQALQFNVEVLKRDPATGRYTIGLRA